MGRESRQAARRRRRCPELIQLERENWGNMERGGRSPMWSICQPLHKWMANEWPVAKQRR